MGEQYNAYGQKETTAQQVLPVVGQVIGSLFGPIGAYAGHGIGEGVGNTIAVGDAAGAPAGTEASAETNLGGLFQGQGLSGFWSNYLAPQLKGGPGAGEGGGSLGFLQGIMGAQSGAGNYPVGGSSGTSYTSSGPVGSTGQASSLGEAILGLSPSSTTASSNAGKSSSTASGVESLAGSLLSSYLGSVL